MASFNRSLIRVLLLVFILVLLLASALPALADYLGPDRTRTETVEVCKVVLLECQYVPSKGQWKYKVKEPLLSGLVPGYYEELSQKARCCWLE